MKVCFIGMCGHSMQAYSVLKQRPNVELCGVAPGSSHENMTASFDEAIPFYPSYTEMLDKVCPDLAVVSPVFGLTSQVILECTARGIDVFSEKPVATTLDELDRVEKAVRESGIRFGAMHYLRCDPAFYQGAKMVREGAIGEVRLMTAQKSYRFGKRPAWYSDPDLYGGTIPWVGIHAIDWVYAFSNKRFLRVTAQTCGSPDMTALCQFEMEDGVMASVNLDYYRPETAPTHGDDRIRCAGTKGVLEVMDGRIHLINQNGVQIITPTEAPELLESFLNGTPVMEADEIFYLTRVALAAKKAANQHNTVNIM